ncbi:4048_t:CDS:2 [Paraglomus occultum]|uniref:4048_t:CDS:1 n=1 Tax=Paraglomus occultum TaxID=144539 RepID=A0A9N9FT98_9GLOM|nr:4048_t:CDS:2 [Paraglomus occultum]
MPLWKEKVLKPFRRLSQRSNKKDKSKPTTSHASVEADGKAEETKISHSHARSRSNSSASSSKAEASQNADQHVISRPRKPGQWTTVAGGEKDPVAQCGVVVQKDVFKTCLDLTEYDFSQVDKHARGTSKANTVRELSKRLTSRWKGKEIYQLRAIYTWIAENISYDANAFFSGKPGSQNADDVMKKGTAVCDGYAELFKALAEEAGLNVRKITGKAKGAGYKPGDDLETSQLEHAWIGVCLDGEYLLIDPTWGAGTLNGRTFNRHFDPFYFLASPQQFIYSHLPDDENEQYLSPPVTQELFIKLPFVKPPFFRSGLMLVEYVGSEIKVKHDKFEMEVVRCIPDESKPLHAVLEWEGKKVNCLVQRVGAKIGSEGERFYTIRCEIPSSGEGKLNLFVLLEGNKGPIAASFKVVNHGNGSRSPPYVQTFSVPFTFTISEPIYSKLAYNRRTKFELTIFDKDENELPEFDLFTPDKETRKLQKISWCPGDKSTTYAIDTILNIKGEWVLVYTEGGNSVNFIAQYEVE